MYKNEINFTFSKKNNYKKYRNRIEMNKVLESVVVFGHGSIDISTFIKVPDDFLIVTFIDDGKLLCDIESKSKSGYYPSCVSMSSRFIYMWQEYLLHSIQSAKFQNKKLLDVIRETSKDMNNQIDRYLNEYVPFLETQPKHANLYFPGQLISDTKINFARDKYTRLGVSSMEDFIDEKNTMKSTNLNEFSFPEHHIMSDFSKTFPTKKIYLGQLLDYVIEKTKETSEKTKVLFLFTCREIENTFINNFLTYKPWQISSPFKSYLEKLDYLTNQNSQLFQSQLTKLDQEMKKKPKIIYEYFCFGSQESTPSKLLSKGQICCIDYKDFLEYDHKTSYYLLIGIPIPIRDMTGDLLEMNFTEFKSFFLPDNIVGEIIWSALQKNPISSIIKNKYFDILWNQRSRFFIFDRWLNETKKYLKKEYADTYITFMAHLFIYKKIDNEMYMQNEIYKNLFIELANIYLFNVHSFYEIFKKYIIPEYFDKIRTDYYYYGKINENTDTFMTPFEYAIAKFRFVDENNSSLINSVKSLDELQHVDGKILEYEKKKLYPLQNFYGKFEMYLYVYQVLLNKIENFCISNMLINKSIKYIMEFYNYQFVQYIQNKEKVYEPKHITYFDGSHVICGNYLLKTWQ